MNNKPKATVSKKLALCVFALFMIALCVISFIVMKPFDKQENNAVLDSASEASVKQVTDFEDDSVRTNAKFSDAIFKRTCAAAIAYTGEESDLEKIASTLSLESVMVTNDRSKIVAAYPADLVGKSLKELEGTKKLNTVAKGITIKALGDITPAEEEDTYLVYAAASRQDDAGAVAVSLLTDDYNTVLGKDLANSCGSNVIIEKDGERVSSSFAAAGDKTISDLDKAGNGQRFEIKLDGKTYEAKVAAAGDYSVLTAVEKTSADTSDNLTNFLIIAGVDLVLLIAGVVLMAAAGKTKKDA